MNSVIPNMAGIRPIRISTTRSICRKFNFFGRCWKTPDRMQNMEYEIQNKRTSYISTLTGTDVDSFFFI